MPLASKTLPARITDCGDFGRSTRMMRFLAFGIAVSNDFLPAAAEGAAQAPNDFSSNAVTSASDVSPTTTMRAFSGLSHA